EGIEGIEGIEAIGKVFSQSLGLSILDEIRYRLETLNATFERASNANAQLIISGIKKALADMETGKRGFLLTGKNEFLAPYRHGTQQTQALFSELETLVSAGYSSHEMLAKLKNLRNLANTWRREAGQPEIMLRRRLDTGSTSMLEVASLIEVGEGKILVDKIWALLEEMVAIEESNIALHIAKAQRTTDQIAVSVILSNIAAAILVFTAGLYLLTTILGSLKRLEIATRHVADGDFSKRIEIESDDSLGKLSIAFNQMAEQLSDAYTESEMAQSRMESQAEFLEVAVSNAEQANLDLNEQKFAMDQHALISATDIRGTITMANEKFAEISGYTIEELIGQNHRLLKSPHHDEDFFREMYLSISKGKVWHGDICNKNKKGKLYWVSTTIVPFFKDGKVDQYISIRSDITANKLTEKSLIESRVAAEEAVLTKSQFLANMSHEIRTPMNGVLGMIGLVMNSQLDAEQDKRLGMARSSAQSLLTIINDILDFSKVEARMIELEEISFDLRMLLGDLSETMAFKSEEKDVALILDVCGVEHSMVTGDPSRLRQILTNLVSNAIKFTEHGEIVISAALAERHHPAGTLILTCSVTDSGIGIPEEARAHIFDAFTQVDSSTTREYGGTGLGLSIVKQLCLLMGGDISVHCPLGGGSCFEFTIELRSSEQSVEVTPEINMAEFNILVVDNNDTNRAVLSDQFQHWGATVESAENGPSALKLLDRQLQEGGKPFTVAFIDSDLPGMSGEELGKEIKNIPKLDDTKLVIMTSTSEDKDLRYYTNIGFNGYFPRPATTSDLFDALADLVNHDVHLAAASAPPAAPVDSPDSEEIIRYTPGKSNSQSPTASPQNASDQLAVTSLPWPETARVLIAEDNLINQTLLMGLLESFDLDFEVCEDGKEVLQALQDSPDSSMFSLILMDCQMPVMDGFSATTAIREGEAGKRYQFIPIIALTANAMQGDREVCIKAGMDDYISKPFLPDALNALLQKWIVERDIHSTPRSSFKALDHH
ncbi:MAG: response regulator, partial [Pseudomonadales bacterium]|nr:response regulator [Pseudomonadales bacterium]